MAVPVVLHATIKQIWHQATYLACSTCAAAVAKQHDSTFRCKKCCIVIPADKAHPRWRLCMSVLFADEASTERRLISFGPAVDLFFGCSADKYQKFAESLASRFPLTAAHVGSTHLLQHTLSTVLCDTHIICSLRPSQLEQLRQAEGSNALAVASVIRAGSTSNKLLDSLELYLQKEEHRLGEALNDSSASKPAQQSSTAEQDTPNTTTAPSSTTTPTAAAAGATTMIAEPASDNVSMLHVHDQTVASSLPAPLLPDESVFMDTSAVSAKSDAGAANAIAIANTSLFNRSVRGEQTLVIHANGCEHVGHLDETVFLQHGSDMLDALLNFSSVSCAASPRASPAAQQGEEEEEEQEEQGEEGGGAHVHASHGSTPSLFASQRTQSGSFSPIRCHMSQADDGDDVGHEHVGDETGGSDGLPACTDNGGHENDEELTLASPPSELRHNTSGHDGDGRPKSVQESHDDLKSQNREQCENFEIVDILTPQCEPDMPSMLHAPTLEDTPIGQYDPEIESSEEAEFEVESIEAFRIQTMDDGRWEPLYLIKWKGYDSSANTWEPEMNLSEDTIVSNALTIARSRAALVSVQKKAHLALLSARASSPECLTEPRKRATKRRTRRPVTKATKRKPDGGAKPKKKKKKSLPLASEAR